MLSFVSEHRPFVPRWMEADWNRWHDVCRCGRRDQRTHRPGRHLGAGTHAETGEICRRVDIHDPTVHAKRAVGSIDCLAFELEVLRCSVWCLGRGGIYYDGDFLLPSAESEFAGFDEEGNPKPDRLHWRFSQYFGNAVVHGW